MKIFLISLVCILSFVSCKNQTSDAAVEQVIIMIGTEADGYDSSKELSVLSDTNTVLMGGNDYGGTLTLTIDGANERKWSSGGNFTVLNSEIDNISINGKVTKTIYMVAVLQVFNDWPDDFSGVILLKEKFSPGIIQYSASLAGLIDRGLKILR